jgi:hypothetical protein
MKKQSIAFVLAALPVFAACPAGMVESGVTCIDRFEASLWETDNPTAINLIKSGSVLSAPQLIALGAIQRGVSGIDYTNSKCNFNGGGCTNLYAVSIFGVIPARSANYFIGAAACRNSGKRLPSNAEWQAAALGTPDPGPREINSQNPHPCNVGPNGQVALTGAHPKCRSDVGAVDMVGNVIEFVGDWGPLATTGTTWDVFLPGFGNDVTNIGGSPNGSIYGLPGTTLRGGSFAPGSGGSGEQAGVYAIDQNGAPNSVGNATAAGFRCAR